MDREKGSEVYAYEPSRCTMSEISLPFKITKFHTALPIDFILKSHRFL